MSLPEAFCQRMQILLKEEYPAFLSSLDEDRTAGLRVNPCKKRDGLTAFLKRTYTLSPVAWCADGFQYRPEERPGRSLYHEAGAFYIQEPSAMSAAELVFADRPFYAEDDGPAWKICDLCAAPGGKSTQLAGHMKGKGLLWSNEIHPERAKILSRNIERLGIRNAIVSNETPERLADRFPRFFDRILVDAPCSGEGMFRKNGEAEEEWSPENVLLCAKRQRQILACADRMLKPGGILVYSTCTFAPEEDEQTAEFLLREFGYELEDLRDEKPAGMEKTFGECFSEGRPEWGSEGRPELSRCFRLFPHLCEGEGHFAARFRKPGSSLEGRAEAEESVSGKKRKDLRREEKSAAAGRRKDAMTGGKGAELTGKEGCLSFLAQEIPALAPDLFRAKNRLTAFGDQWYLLPEGAPELSGLKILRPGLALAEEKKGRYEPAHALALALGEADPARVCRLTADSPEAQGFLKGEGFSFEGEKGWYLICADGFSIGWGKSDGKTMKNHYPKGLRVLWT